jgi:hypothetical protein
MTDLCRCIQYELKSNGFYVCKTRPVQYGTRFHLGVGPIITVYTTGSYRSFFGGVLNISSALFPASLERGRLRAVFSFLDSHF